MNIKEANKCIRGCCYSNSIPLHLPSSSFSLNSPIARGSESVVYEGTLDGRKVAIKKPVLSTSDDLDKFHRELQLLCKLDHPGIGKLIAAHAKPPNYMFFFELYESGNLAQKLHVEEWSPGIHQALPVIIRLAEALQYLHSLGIVHRDVKPANILLGEDLSPHLSDFGLSEYGKNLKKSSVENWKSSGKPTGGFHKKNMVGTLIYMAPEVLRKEIHTEKSDVYSFAITVNELLTGVVPYTDLRTEAEAHTVLEMNYTEQKLVAAVVSEGLRPVLASSESGTPSSLLSLITRCWDADPNNRPSFTDVVAELNLIWNEVKSVDEKSTVSEPTVSSQKQMEQSVRSQLYGESINWFSEGKRSSDKILLGVAPDKTASTDYSNGASSYLPVLSWGSFATCGQRETMEDTHFIMPQFSDQKDVHLFGVFDGHRGAAAAEFSVGALPGFLKGLDPNGSPSEYLVSAFVETDASFKKIMDSNRQSKGSIKKPWHPGCTAIVALLIKDKLFIANAGDCRAILCRSGNAIALSKDHVASCVEERHRVVEAGGLVKWQVDTWRVGSAALQVTRSIGDDDLKPSVTAEPEITETCLCPDDEYLVMASDGLWDVMSNEEVVSIVRDTVKESNMCSKRLATEAVQRGSKDNITVILVFLRPVTTAERIY